MFIFSKRFFLALTLLIFSIGCTKTKHKDDLLTYYFLLQLFSSPTGKLVQTGSPQVPTRTQYTPVVLSSGKVLLAGGLKGSQSAGNFLSSAEIYDPATGAFTLLSNSLDTNRHAYNITVMNNGNVLLAGGITGNNTLGSTTNLSTGTVYDSSANTFTVSTNSMAGGPRSNGVAIGLKTGNVIVIAGGGGGSSVNSTSDIYNPTTNAFSVGPSLTTTRNYHAGTLLSDGKVLVTGGADISNVVLKTSEIYDPTTNAFTASGTMSDQRVSHSSILSSSGNVMIFGSATSSFTGSGNSRDLVSNVLTYTTSTGQFSVSGTTSAVSTNQGSSLSTVLLKSGNIFVGCGSSSGMYIYNTTTGVAIKDPILSNAGICGFAVGLKDGTVLLIGTSSIATTGISYIYTPPEGY